jgi:hypothetical protein
MVTQGRGRAFKTPDFRWQPDTREGKAQGQLCGTKHFNKGKKFSYFKSYFVDDTAFILLSREELVTASNYFFSSCRQFEKY